MKEKKERGGGHTERVEVGPALGAKKATSIWLESNSISESARH